MLQWAISPNSNINFLPDFGGRGDLSIEDKS